MQSKENELIDIIGEHSTNVSLIFDIYIETIDKIDQEMKGSTGEMYKRNIDKATCNSMMAEYAEMSKKIMEIIDNQKND